MNHQELRQLAENYMSDEAIDYDTFVHRSSQLAREVWGLLDEIEELRLRIEVALVAHWRRGDYCDACGGGFPCFTRRTLLSLYPQEDK